MAENEDFLPGYGQEYEHEQGGSAILSDGIGSNSMQDGGGIEKPLIEAEPIKEQFSLTRGGGILKVIVNGKARYYTGLQQIVDATRPNDDKTKITYFTGPSNIFLYGKDGVVAYSIVATSGLVYRGNVLPNYDNKTSTVFGIEPIAVIEGIEGISLRRRKSVDILPVKPPAAETASVPQVTPQSGAALQKPAEVAVTTKASARIDLADDSPWKFNYTGGRLYQGSQTLTAVYGNDRFKVFYNHEKEQYFALDLKVEEGKAPRVFRVDMGQRQDGKKTIIFKDLMYEKKDGVTQEEFEEDRARYERGECALHEIRGRKLVREFGKVTHGEAATEYVQSHKFHQGGILERQLDAVLNRFKLFWEATMAANNQRAVAASTSAEKGEKTRPVTFREAASHFSSLPANSDRGIEVARQRWREIRPGTFAYKVTAQHTLSPANLPSVPLRY
ncbi:MAG: hypothetical protein GC136_11470 [Alphaproteobacteria bacterium]|nr:hypothetical protein [Alphaproteobacteria bacterium]